MQTSDINAALRRFYKPTEYALMFEVADATGSNVRRHADAVAMNLWPSRGLYIEGIEVKVSRADWRRELDNPAKSWPVQKYCDQWWIVAPEGIVQEIELPPLWGLRTVNDKLSIRTVKQAPKLTPEPVSKGFVAAMLRRASEADAAVVDRLVNEKLAGEREQIKKQIDTEVERRSKQFAKLESTIAEFKKHGVNLVDPYLSAEDMADAYRLGTQMKKNYTLNGLEHTAKRLEEAASMVREVGAALSH